MLNSPVFLFCCSTWWTQDIRRFLSGKQAAPEAIKICSSETMTYSPIYVTCFLSYDTDTWQCFWLITFVLGCFALVLFFGFLFSTSMLGWLHVSLGLELVDLRLAHVLVPVIVLVFVDFKNHVLTWGCKQWHQCFGWVLHWGAVQSHHVSRKKFVLLCSVLLLCYTVCLYLCLQHVLYLCGVWCFETKKPSQDEASPSPPCLQGAGIQHAVGGSPPPLPPPPPRPSTGGGAAASPKTPPKLGWCSTPEEAFTRTPEKDCLIQKLLWFTMWMLYTKTMLIKYFRCCPMFLWDVHSKEYTSHLCRCSNHAYRRRERTRWKRRQKRRWKMRRKKRTGDRFWWLHVSLVLELVYLRLAHVLVPVIVLVIVPVIVPVIELVYDTLLNRNSRWHFDHIVLNISIYFIFYDWLITDVCCFGTK